MASATVTIAFLDGTDGTWPAEKTIGQLRRRANIGSQKLCCDGQLLSDNALISSLPEHRRLTAWPSRYSSARSIEPSAAGALTSHASITGRQLWRLTQTAAKAVLPALRAVGIGVWLKLIIWLGLFWAVCRVDLGGPFLVVSALYLVWHAGFSENSGSSGVSAYTVFNEGMQALPGQ